MEILDLRGLKCPLPILKTKKALAKLQIGDKVCVWVTDESAPTDFKQFCYQTGHSLLENTMVDDGYYQIVIQRK